MPNNIPHNAYTNAPEQHPNLILGTLQMLFWLFFRPSVWLKHLKRTNKLRLIIQGYLILPVLTNLLLGLVLWIWGKQIASINFYFLFGLVVGVVAILTIRVALSKAIDTASGMTGDVVVSVAENFVTRVAIALTMGIVGNMIAGAGFSLFFGLLGGVAVRKKNQELVVAIHHAIGLLVGVICSIGGNWQVGVVLGLAIAWIAGREVVRITVGLIVRTVVGLVVGLVVGAAVGGVVAGVAVGGVAVDWVINRTTSVSLAVGLAIGVAIGLAAVGVAVRMAISLTAVGVAGGVTVGLALNEAIGLAVSIGITINSWRPVLFLPFITAWNYLLYILDKKRKARSPCLLRYHSAFWDECQRLHLPGLDDYLLFVLEHNPIEGRNAVNHLNTSPQHWAIQSAQIKLDIRKLKRCTTVTTICQVHRSRTSGTLESPVTDLINIFLNISKDVDAALNQTSIYNQRKILSDVAKRLKLQLQEITRSSNKYAPRFYPIAESWLQIITNYIEELVKATELRQEIDNPYIIGIPLNEQLEIFTGRTDIGTRIEHLLLDRHRPPLLLYGQRRMGKTSLLNNIGKLLPNSIIPMFVDLQGAPSSASDYTGFLYNLARGMTTSAKQQSALTLPTLTRETLADDPFTRFYEWLDQVEETLEQNTALLMLDEFETLDSAINRGRFDEEDVLRMLRHLIQHHPHFNILLAGSHTIEEYQRWASYLINVQVVHISYLKEEEARKLIEEPVKDFTLRYEPEAVERVLQLTRCHPFLVQLLCGEIIVLKNEQDPSIRRLASLADVEAAVPEALQSGGFFFADIQNSQVDTNGREILRFIAAQGEGVIVSQQNLSQQFPDVWERTIALLLQRELIEEVADSYRFQVELIRRWFV